MKRIFSIVVPIYQNEANIEDVVPRLLALQDRLPDYRLELVLVDDGSSDRSLEMLSRHLERNPDTVRIVKLTRNFGQTPAIQAGLRYSKGHCVGIVSADLQEPPEAFAEMVAKWEQGSKFVVGARAERDENWWHRTVSGFYWKLIRWCVSRDFPNLGYDFCLLDRQVVDDINRINEKNSSIFVLIYWLGYRPSLVPVKRRLREKGRSQWVLWKRVRLTVDSLIGFTYLPARFITFLGFFAALVCLLYLGLILVHWFSYRAAPPGWMTLVVLLSWLGAMILFSIGIVSEYLLRILDEARQRPLYVVDRFMKKPGEVPDKLEV